MRIIIVLSIIRRDTLRRLPTTSVPATMRGLLGHFRLPCEGCLLAHFSCSAFHTSGYSAEAALGVRHSYPAWAVVAPQATLRGLPLYAFQLLWFVHVSGYSAEAANDIRASYHAWAAAARQATLRGLPYLKVHLL